ncbi:MULTISPECIES: DoxX family protein [Microbacterium]|uniref:DoxX family protein n=1 Tax=Microbacterium TaxID=33882 RepID=UPI0006F7DE91|nr:MULTISPECIES: DoxX family protein [unclassified Microbacterium]MBN9199544.1 DoxX family protein [Microbacterium ginsengisoli]MCK9917014.1 DoxX family protein [Microbacteriaceae bacterium K1510]KQR94248.1 DoxX family protein [Microbacterium sp. Leaf351]KQS02518.1 DoxX family protein [Microbacterium sp. Leaf347]OJU76856.1 MAG: DoxX family protein [Microbacterium sp. 71-23]
MLIALWIVNVVLALAFLATGGLKIIRTPDQLRTVGLAWVESFTRGQVVLIGVAEVVGAVGLIAPLATGILPFIAAVAAAALAVLMVGATVVHVRRGENPAPAAVALVLSLVSAALGVLALG